MTKNIDYIKLARNAVEKYVKVGEVINVPVNLSPDFYKRKCGVFVSIHKGKDLRGCVGTYLPVYENLAEEIIRNAVAACSQDSRFFPVRPEELKELSFEVSLLSRPEKISSLSELDPKKYGVIVKDSLGRAGLLLPDLEGISSAEQQVAIACQKGGINPAIGRDIKIYRFSVEKYSQ